MLNRNNSDNGGSQADFGKDLIPKSTTYVVESKCSTSASASATTYIPIRVHQGRSQDFYLGLGTTLIRPQPRFSKK